MSILSQTLSSVFSKSQRARRKAFKHLQSGDFPAAAVLCDKILRENPQDPSALQFLSAIADRIVAPLESAPADDPVTACANYRSSRTIFIDLLLALPDDSILPTKSEALARAHSKLFDSELREMPRDESEERTFTRLKEALLVSDSRSREPNTAQLLAAMLICHGFELPIFDIRGVSQSIQAKYSQFLLNAPHVFQQPGDADANCKHLARTIAMFHRICIVDGAPNRTSDSQSLANHAARATFVHAYFTTQNLRSMMTMRGDLMSTALAGASAITLFALPSRKVPNKKIRLGVFTITLSTHTDPYFTLAHIEKIDRSKFHLIVYVLNLTGGPVEERVRSRVDQLTVLPMDALAEQAQTIRNDDLDILLFGANASSQARAAAFLGSLRLARNQISTVSSPITTGLRHMDYMLSAHMNETCTDAASHFSEQLLLMPGSINCYPFQYDTDLPTGHFDRSSLGVSPNSIVFFSGANFFKIVPEISLVWARILAAVPNSVLVLMPYNPNWAAHYRTLPFTLRLNRQLLAAGVASDRLRILNAVPTRADLQQIVAAADIYLDAYPFAGACSMLDPMVVGTPPVVRTGPVGRSQHGAALMRMAGLEEVICTSDEEYIATAIDLASNPARRQKIRSTLLSYKATGVPEYFDTEKFSKKVGDALIDIHETYLSRYSKFEHADRGARRDSLRQLARSVAGHNLELAAMNDIGIVHSLIVPYFQHQPVARQRHMIDVGSCYGVMADPFLAIDWTADMFEPDPSPRPKLEQNVLKYGGRGRVFAIAVTDTSRTEIEFHRSYDGLSGLGESPFQSTAAIIKVPCTSLANFYVDQGVKFVDFLKIDAEGFDFNVLRSHNFNAMKPSLVMVEYGTHFESEAVPIVNQAIDEMAKAGYGVVVFNYDDDGKFLKGDFTYRLTDIWVDEHLPDLGRVMFGNLLFYRAEDDDFLLNLYSLLDNCRPRSTVSAH